MAKDRLEEKNVQKEYLIVFLNVNIIYVGIYFCYAYEGQNELITVKIVHNFFATGIGNTIRKQFFGRSAVSTARQMTTTQWKKKWPWDTVVEKWKM